MKKSMTAIRMLRKSVPELKVLFLKKPCLIISGFTEKN